MTSIKLPFAFLAAATLGLTIPGTAVAQHGASHTQMAQNTQAAEALRARLDMTRARIAEAQSGRKITRTRGAALQRQVAQTRQSMIRLGKRPGFVSAGELASYNRTLAAIDLELDRRGVARSYGNDMLVNPAAK